MVMDSGLEFENMFTARDIRYDSIFTFCATLRNRKRKERGIVLYAEFENSIQYLIPFVHRSSKFCNPNDDYERNCIRPPPAGYCHAGQSKKSTSLRRAPCFPGQSRHDNILAATGWKGNVSWNYY